MATPRQAPLVVRWQAALNQYLGQQLPPGPAFIPWYYVINLQKCGTLPFTLSLMWWYGNWSNGALCYCAVHSSYGLIWLLKHFLIPDPQWNTKITALSAVASFALVLGPYWIAPVVLISRAAPEVRGRGGVRAARAGGCRASIWPLRTARRVRMVSR